MIRGGFSIIDALASCDDLFVRYGGHSAAAGFTIANEHLPELEQRLLRYGEVNGARDSRVAHVSNLSLNGWRSDELVAALDLRGVCVSAGSACSAGTIEPSPVITNMLGLERAARAVRISLGVETTAAAAETATLLLEEVLESARPPQLSPVS